MSELEERAKSVQSLIKTLMPAQAENMRKLEELIKIWPSVVGPAGARFSAPYDLKAGVLYVAARNPHAAQLIGQMRGNIQRILSSRLEMRVDDVHVTQGQLTGIPSKRGGRKITKNVQKMKDVVVTNEELRECLALFPKKPEPDFCQVAEAIAHLRVFMRKRKRGGPA